MRILAVDDTQDNLTTLRAVLRDALPDCEVLTAADGPRGIELARREDLDAILLDIAMPGMDGYAVCRQLKADERLCEIPVLFLTAHRTDQEGRVRALESGADGFLTKPWDEVELVAQIRAMARIRAASRRQRLESESLVALVAERTRELHRELAERRRAEESLRTSEMHYRSLAENSPDLIARFDRQCRHLYVNAAAARAGRFTPAEYVGMTIAESGSAAADARKWEERIRAVFETGVTTAIDDAFVTPSGTMYYDTRFVPEFAPDGSVHSVQSIARDITARRQAEARLVAITKAVESTSDAVGISDATGHHFYQNRALSELFGYATAEELQAAGGGPAVVRDPEVARALFESIMGGTPWTGELDMVTKSGRVFPAYERADAVKDDDGKVIGLIRIITDITNRKRASQYREMGVEVLQTLSGPGSTRDCLHRVLSVLKTWTGLDAVGIRLQEGDDFPYVTQQGFPRDFLLAENSLVERGADGGICRSEDGRVSLECTCGLVISGKTDPARPLFTWGGSFWTNDSASLLDLASDQDPRHHPRNRCFHLGYASVALVPIRDKDRIVGLIHLNDRRRGCFSRKSVELLEGIAAHIGLRCSASKPRRRRGRARSASGTCLRWRLKGSWSTRTSSSWMRIRRSRTCSATQARTAL